MKLAIEELGEVIQLLTQIEEDETVPKNVRARIKDELDLLRDPGKLLGMKINQVLQELGEVSEDPKIPIYTRTQIWNIISLLEGAA